MCTGTAKSTAQMHRLTTSLWLHFTISLCDISWIIWFKPVNTGLYLINLQLLFNQYLWKNWFGRLINTPEQHWSIVWFVPFLLKTISFNRRILDYCKHAIDFICRRHTELKVFIRNAYNLSTSLKSAMFCQLNNLNYCLKTIFTNKVDQM